MRAELSKLQPQLLTAVASDIIYKVIGARPRNVRQEPRGVMTFKVIAEMPGEQRYIVRFYPTDRSHIVAFEPDLMRIAFELGVSAPDVVTDSRIGPNAPMAYVVYRMICGERLTDKWAELSQWQKNRLVSEIVENLDLLTSIRVSGYGELTTANQARHTSWDEFLGLSVRVGVKAARLHGELPESILRSIERLETEYSEFAHCDNTTIAWSDISPDNIIVNSQGELAGFIDFEGMLSGDRVLTLGYLYARYYETDFAKLILDSYSSVADEPFFRKVYFFAVLRGLRLLPHLDRPLPTGVQRLPVSQIFPGFAPALQNLLRPVQKESVRSEKWPNSN